jgi:uncharacterized protein YbaR (Trm112 family)
VGTIASGLPRGCPLDWHGDRSLEEILNILACPNCRFPFKLKIQSLICTNPECRRVYSIHEEGFPVLLIDQSTVISPEKWQSEINEGSKGDPAS